MGRKSWSGNFVTLLGKGGMEGDKWTQQTPDAWLSATLYLCLANQIS